LYVLGAQPTQPASPSAPPPASKPAAHTRSQEPSPAATYSASHRHMLTLREPAGALEYGVHATHGAFSVVFLYVFAAHAAQVTPAVLAPSGAKPGVHRHALASVAAS
jgi:hypothetical protein